MPRVHALALLAMLAFLADVPGVWWEHASGTNAVASSSWQWRI